jgi:hypothetical protein
VETIRFPGWALILVDCRSSQRAPHHHSAKERLQGDSNMTVVLFVLASASLFGFTGYLFRDQIMSKRE